MKFYAFVTIIALMMNLQIHASYLSFSISGLTGWKEKSFSGNTHYKIVNEGKKKILFAQSSNSASALYNQNEIQLKNLPYLSWRWKVTHIGEGNDEQSKMGDDYPVRLYVITKDKIKFWKSYSIVYVWSNNAQPDESWVNPFTSNVRHIAVDAGDDYLGQWRSHERDVIADFSRVFGLMPDKLEGIAIMTDSDNSMQNFEAWYGDIVFDSKRKQL